MKPNALANCNPALSHLDGVYVDGIESVYSSNLSSYLTIAVPKLLADVIDKSLFSIDLENKLNTPELRTEFSPAAYNMLKACDFNTLVRRDHALDLSQDFGGVAHYLSDFFKEIDTVKLDIKRAHYSQLRCKTHTSVNYFCHPVSELNFPEKHYDLIFIGKLEELALSHAQTQSLLKKLKRALSENGVLIISLKNRDRLSKWLNTERHESEPLIPLRDLYVSESDALFNYPEISTILNKSGYACSNSYASFSSRSVIANLLSLNYLESANSALNHFNRLGSVATSSLNEYLMYETLHQQGKSLIDVASRYVIFASNKTNATLSTPSKELFDYDFVHFPGTSRKPQWRTITAKKRHKNTVTKESLHPTLHAHSSSNAHDTATLLSQNLEPQLFHDGVFLLQKWLHAILKNDATEFAHLIHHYYQWLKQLESATANSEKFSEFAYDLLPFNIICSNNENNLSLDDLNIIDPEWQVKAHISLDFILFRALFWFAFDNRALMSEFCDQSGFQNIDTFVRYYLNRVCNNDSLEDHINVDKCIDKYIALEENIQREISADFNTRSISMAMHQDFANSELSIDNTAPQSTQITWADADNNFDQINAVHIDWPNEHDALELKTKFVHRESSQKILRVDPINISGSFVFEKIELLDCNDNCLWSLRSASEITSSAELHNSVDSQHESESNYFIALNDDPYFLFDLTHVQNLSSTDTIKLTVGMILEPKSNNTIKRLRELVNQQAAALVKLGNKGHETRANIDLLNSKLEHLENERRHLAELNKDMQSVMEENKRLHTALMQTPSQRIKRIIKTVLSVFNASNKNH